MARVKFANRAAALAGVLAWAFALQFHGQQRPLADEVESNAAPSSIAEVLHQMTRSADVIFAGEVTAVKRPAGYEDMGGGTVTIEFRVDQAVRGCTSGSVYTLQEWGGLWSASGDQYRVGKRLLMFLHRPGTSGLSSPVHGAEGAVPLRGGGTPPGPFDAKSVAAEWMVDLRWVQAQTVRSASEWGEPVPWESSRGPKPVSAMLPVEGGFASPPLAHWTPVTPEAERGYLPLAQLLELCRGWIGEARAQR